MTKKSKELQATQVIPSSESTDNDLKTALAYQASRLAKLSKDPEVNCIFELKNLAQANKMINEESRSKEAHDNLNKFSQAELLQIAKTVIQKLPQEEKQLLLKSLLNDADILNLLPATTDEE